MRAHGVTGDARRGDERREHELDRLRIVSQLADGGLKQEATLVSVIPETNGSFKTFAETVGADVNFTEFKYRVSDDAQAVVLYSRDRGGRGAAGGVRRGSTSAASSPRT